MAQFEIMWDDGVAGGALSAAFATIGSGDPYLYDSSFADRLSRVNGGTNRLVPYPTAMGTPANQEVALICETMNATGLAGGAAVRVSGSTSANINCYVAYIQGDATNELRIGKYVSGTLSSVGAVANSKGITAVGGYCVRLQAIGTALKARFWAKNTAEPSGWDIEVTDSSLSSGRAGPFTTNSGTYKLGKMSIGTDGDGAPALYYQILGTVQDASANPLERDVIAIDRVGRRVRSKTTSAADGTFTINVPRSTQYAVVAFDSDDGDENAIILDRIVPVQLA